MLDTDITALDVDAIANAANTRLLHGGGVAGAISRAGGPAVQEESHQKAPIGLGEAVETTAGDMPARWVIHAATMELGGPTDAGIIRRATAATLARADELGARSLALVAFGTGVGGFPLEEAARIEVEEVRRHLDEGSRPRTSGVRGARRRRAPGLRGRPRLSELAGELAALGGVAAPATATARLRDVLLAALRHGSGELDKPRSGYGAPVEVAIAAADGMLLAATPAAAAFRADPEAAGERTWLLVAATLAALVELAEPGPPAGAGDLQVRAGDLGGFLLVGLPGNAGPEDLAELAPLAFDDHAARLDRLRARAVAIPGRLLEGNQLREPIGPHHPLRIAEAVARLGGRPEEPRSVEQHEEAVLALLQAEARTVRPHEDPDPARRIARRILQRLDGMGKWGGYHTDFAHLARGFAGNERALAQSVGEALLEAGLLAEKPSVGQRHVFLNPRRAADIRRLIDEGSPPPGMRLPSA